MDNDRIVNLNFESQECNTIPHITGQLVVAYNNQDKTISKKDSEIRELKENSSREEVKCCKLESELASITRKIYCTVEDTKELESKILYQKDNLNQLLMDNLKLKAKVKHFVQSVAERKQQNSKYIDKISNYDYNILSLLENTVETIKLTKLKTKFEEINQQIKTKDGCIFNIETKAVHKDMVKLTSEKEELISKQALFLTQITEIKVNLENIEKEKEIYFKRNQAQFKRIQKQLKDSNSCRKKKYEELELLKQRVQFKKDNK